MESDSSDDQGEKSEALTCWLCPERERTSLFPYRLQQFGPPRSPTPPCTLPILALPWARPTGVGLYRLGGFDSRPARVTIVCDPIVTLAMNEKTYRANGGTHANRDKRKQNCTDFQIYVQKCEMINGNPQCCQTNNYLNRGKGNSKRPRYFRKRKGNG